METVLALEIVRPVISLCKENTKRPSVTRNKVEGGAGDDAWPPLATSLRCVFFFFLTLHGPRQKVLKWSLTKNTLSFKPQMLLFVCRLPPYSRLVFA